MDPSWWTDLFVGTCVKISRSLARSARDFLEDDIRTMLEAADCTVGPDQARQTTAGF